MKDLPKSARPIKRYGRVVGYNIAGKIYYRAAGLQYAPANGRYYRLDWREAK